jgi:hypothetical protein
MQLFGGAKTSFGLKKKNEESTGSAVCHSATKNILKPSVLGFGTLQNILNNEQL